MGSVNVTEGTASGTFTDGHTFTFTISSAVSDDVKIYGRNAQGGSSSWFSPDPATITAGSTSTSPEAVETSPAGSYFTYAVTGINVTATAHIQVGSSMPHEKAS
ncbi:MAG TPA: hypothetical protein VFF64_13290 [Candidatus Eremiobacteraceae bacterium]|nr:hypothetical protein [Candidatus Eremiobacteraceae bacterium]